MKIAIIDADLVGRKKHRFPNLACEKISGYWKGQGADVKLKLDYENLDDYDQVFVSKVFTDTPVPVELTESDRIHMGGTGFYFNQAPPLPYEIEHHMPDYHLYDEWIDKMIEEGASQDQFKEYRNSAIGFLTRGCFRHCPFCVNQKYNRVFEHSPLDEFLNGESKRICMLDDNFFGYSHWKELLQRLIDTKKPFKFKQGLDERLLTDEKCEMLFNARYDGDFTFAFDNVSDYDLIQKKLEMIRRHTTKTNIKFYVLVGFESTDAEDIKNAFLRIELLGRYGCLPYIMRYRSKDDVPYEHSKYRGMYIQLARWCNQPNFFKKKTFREFCEANQAVAKNQTKLCSAMQALVDFEKDEPELAKQYFDTVFYVNPKK